MKNTRLLLSTACIAIGLSFPAIAEPTNAELDQRLRAVEGNIAAILELLKAQQSGGSAAIAEPNTPTEAAVPAGYQMGALYLDVFTEVYSNDEYIRMRDPSRLPDGPKAGPAGSAIVAAPASFAYGSFVTEPSLSSFEKAAALVGTQWSGVISIAEPREYTFAIQLKKAPEDGVNSCRSVLRIADKIVADAMGRYNGSREQVDTAQSVQNLTTGLYDFSLWTTCVRYEDDGFDTVETSVSMAAPDDRAPKPISSERFGVQP